jgi:hypothetical protein
MPLAVVGFDKLTAQQVSMLLQETIVISTANGAVVLCFHIYFWQRTEGLTDELRLLSARYSHPLL